MRLAYTAGAIVGTGALGVALLADPRRREREAGWAFQLQDPRTIMLLLLLATAITANLLGLFELPVLGGSARPAGSFGTGALAAFVATPCAGPFLGAALGTALLLPAAGSVAGVRRARAGPCAPFLLVAFVPALRSKLPKPGRWMDRLKRFLAIPMAATRRRGLVAAPAPGGQSRRSRSAIAVSSRSCSVLQVLAGCSAAAGAAPGSAEPGFAASVAAGHRCCVPAQPLARPLLSPGAEPWSEAARRAYLAQGKPVFVYFTADWCLTCKANEAAAIDRDEVRDAFKQAGVKVLAGDWTNGDPAITRFLESRGRAGVPLTCGTRPGSRPRSCRRS